MNPIVFDDVTFSYPPDDADELDARELEAEFGPAPVISQLSLELPDGLTFVVGPNGIGKSTLMLLAAARLFPQSGTITVMNEPTGSYADAGFDPDLEERRNRVVSFVYQNMEFETESPIGDVLEAVASNSVDPGEASDRFREILEAADLKERLDAHMQELSKGEMQRAIVAMSLLYGSPIVMMDEPVFAVEPARAERLFEYLRESCRRRNHSIYVSAHDVQLARTFSDAVILMHADRLVETGSPAELLDKHRLEEAFKAPWDTLYRRQALYREFLIKSGDA